MMKTTLPTLPSDGIFARRYSKGSFLGRPCLFLDRDGVLVEEVNYLHRLEDVAFIPDVAAAIARVNGAGIAVVMVTNQAGIGRGYFDWEAFHDVQSRIFDYYAAHGAWFDMALACACHHDGIGAYAVADHPWRKPQPGMLLEAAQALGVDLSRSFIVGDSISDLAAGEAGGLPSGALVLTGHGPREWAEKGKTAFTRWNAGDSFHASLAENPAAAIKDWYDRLEENAPR